GTSSAANWTSATGSPTRRTPAAPRPSASGSMRCAAMAGSMPTVRWSRKGRTTPGGATAARPTPRTWAGASTTSWWPRPWPSACGAGRSCASRASPTMRRSRWTMTTEPARAVAPGWRGVLANLRQRKVLAMLLLGFSSGMPIYLVGNTLGFWMRENAIELSTIGFLSWVGLAYSLKFLWAPLVDKLDAPVLGRWLGRRRGWMMLAQLVVAAALVGMALVQPGEGGLVLAGVRLDQLMVFGGLALVVAFASATQDIVIDAWRIESADSPEQQGLLTSTSTLGYRGALLVTDALILIIAAQVGWVVSYTLMAVLMGVGVFATLYVREPAATGAAAAIASPVPLLSGRGMLDAVVGPFVAFFRQRGRWALLMLLVISLYRLPDFLMGPMANPFYADLGIDKETVGAVRGSVGLVATVRGVAAAGLSAVRFGFGATRRAAAVPAPAPNLASPHR